MSQALAALIFAHGAVHGIMFGLALIPEVKAEMAPFNPSESWLVGEVPRLAFGLALAVTAAFLVAGAGYLGDAAWWPNATIGAAALSLLVLTLFADRYFVVGFPISIGLAIWACLA